MNDTAKNVPGAKIDSILIEQIAEFDINPLIVHAEGKGASVAGSRVQLRKK